MYHFCTISSADHLHKTLALYDSLRRIHTDAFLHVLCTEDLMDKLPPGNIALYHIPDLAHLPSAQTIISKYGSAADRLRWSLKPVFLHYLLQEKAHKVIYIDNDIYFFGDYAFLFDQLDTYNFLLTPHHYPRDPGKDQNWLEANFRVGLYNAGFVAVSRAAIDHLDWWAACCAYRCEKNPLRGMFDDQKYLDLMPVMNEGAYVLRHKGCNVAEWNKAVINRTERDGEIYLDEKYPLIFIHFNGTTVRAIEQGEEPLLKKPLATYLENLSKYRDGIRASDLYQMPGILEQIKYRIWRTATDASL
ncbi:MAG: hypothetical protein JST83_12575 [Bacteroidetes bacterium]|nr:hypothetical protein [Bacteroidota bacterium]